MSDTQDERERLGLPWKCSVHGYVIGDAREHTVVSLADVDRIYYPGSAVERTAFIVKAANAYHALQEQKAVALEALRTMVKMSTAPGESPGMKAIRAWMRDAVSQAKDAIATLEPRTDGGDGK